MANRWYVKAFGPVLPASGMPQGKLDSVISFLQALKSAGGATV